MSRSTMFAITLLVSIALAIAVDVQRVISATGGYTRLIANIAGASLALFILGWIVAGILYLLSGRKLSRAGLATTAIIVAAVVAYGAYHGQGL